MLTYEERLEYARSLATERLLEPDCPVDDLDFEVPYITTNGIDMGNPGTKGSLTLLALLAEHEASLLSSKIEMNIDFFEAEAFSFWVDGATKHETRETLEQIYNGPTYRTLYNRAFNTSNKGPNPVHNVGEKVPQPSIFSTAGDDQIAGGTREKVSRITDAHRRNHMVVSDEKDLVSPILWMYCGRFAVRTKQNSIRTPLFDEYQNYDESLMVDDLLIRLFSPASKAQESSNEPNPAIGKAKALELRRNRLPGGWHVIRDKFVSYRFKQRMFAYLPKTKNGIIDPIVELPVALGGLGLGPVSEACIASLSDFHVSLIQSLLEKDGDDRVKIALASFMKDRFARGLTFEDDVFKEAFDELQGELEPSPAVLRTTLQREGLLDQFGSTVGYYAKRRKLGKLGYHGSRELRELFRRSIIQQDLLTKDDVTKGWVQSTWPERREAFETSLTLLYSLREIEGRYEDRTTKWPDRKVLFETLRGLRQEQLTELTFVEDVFYHGQMTYRGAEATPSSSVRYPVQDIIDSLPTLELPGINDIGWFPSGTTQEDN